MGCLAMPRHASPQLEMRAAQNFRNNQKASSFTEQLRGLVFRLRRYGGGGAGIVRIPAYDANPQAHAHFAGEGHCMHTACHVRPTACMQQRAAR